MHVSLLLAGVQQNDEVLVPGLTFVATANAVTYCGAIPHFIDAEEETLGIDPFKLDDYLSSITEFSGECCINKDTGRKISAIVPVHIFGHPCKIEDILEIARKYKIEVVEDAAESLGSFYKGQHTGTFGKVGAISFNGNKVITTGGGGMVLSKNLDKGLHAKHVTTTAKIPHPYEFFHDEPGFNYRLPNLNAALGCAQMEVLPKFLKKKRELALIYKDFFKGSNYKFVVEPKYAQSNYWLNAITCPDAASRESLIKETNANGVMTRPIWRMMHRLPMFKNSKRGDLSISEGIESCLVNIPSSPVNNGQ